MTDVATAARSGQPEAAQGAESARGVRIYRPLTDIVEGTDGVTIMLEMPGVAPGDRASDPLAFSRGPRAGP